MNFKGTKGNWTIGGISADGVFISAKESIRDIATVYKYDDSFLEKQEMEANAKLIATAPKMYNLLQNIFNSQQVEGNYELWNEIKQLLKEANP